VAGSGQAVLLASEIFAGGAATVGILRAEAQSPIWGVGVIRGTNGRGEPILAGFPAWGGDPFAAPGRIPFLVDGDSWSSHLWLLGGAKAVRAEILTSDRAGAASYLPVVWP
jgi:hypothetical protein